MAKYLAMVGGRIKEVFGISASAGAGDAGKIVQLDGAGRLDNSVMPTGIGADTKIIVTSEAIAASNIVNVFNNAGTATARKADATATGKECIGFVLAGVASGANATVYFEGTINGLTGLTPGARYYVSASTPGVLTATPPTTAGNVVQYVGTAISATELSFEPDDAIELA